MRYRTRMPDCCDSMCTSLARSSMASSRISFTSLTTEGSWASSESSASCRLGFQIEAVVVAALGQQAVDRLAADAQVRLDALGDFLAAGQHGHDRQAGGHAQLVQRIEIERIAGGDDQRAVAPVDWKERLPMDEPWWKVFEQFQIDVGLDEVDELQPHFRRPTPAERPLPSETKLHGGLIEAQSFGLGAWRASSSWRASRSPRRRSTSPMSIARRSYEQ